MINYNLNVGGGLLYYDEICSAIANNKNISEVYDNLLTTWSSGRLEPWASRYDSIKKYDTIEFFEKVIRIYTDLDVTFYLAAASPLIDADSVLDRRCNEMLKILNAEGHHGVIITSEVLYNHVKSNYPNLKTKYSVIASYRDNVIDMFDYDRLEYYRDLSNKYDRVVILPELNLDFDLLAGLELTKIEIMVNECCQFACTNKFKHYVKVSSLFQLMYHKHHSRTTMIDQIDEMLVEYMSRKPRGCHLNWAMLLKPEEIRSLIEFGVHHFKIVGREALQEIQQGLLIFNQGKL